MELDIDPNFVSSGERHYKVSPRRVGRRRMFRGEPVCAPLKKGRNFWPFPCSFGRGPRQRNIYHCEGKLKQPSELKGQKIWLLPLRSHRRRLGPRLPARRPRHQDHGHAMVRLRPGSFHWSRAPRQVERINPPPLLAKRSCNSPKCSAKALCTAPSVPGDLRLSGTIRRR